ncbi:hypothetical protein [Spirilliplanes yamanashiensis]|uniref:Uncharacterized protein n=1 Tax=Spirilliplanes yamanashiensis TaxID=42233 RepID=A0A8J3YCR1_9ACTN|nr:hypothetical protein [Spirilliplanes yamanashiensis]MDP9818525.1 hypothetical protein [Spirilliplanes yamanashiensis]GIJ06346.1 hypothetical protein Sya03_56980 [Spirilliplanes yamanashiensis]
MTPSTRALWLAITTLVAILVGSAGGLLGWTSGLNPAAAILTGAGSFTGAMWLMLSVIRFATNAGE